MSPDSKTELSGSGTRPPEWEPDTTDVMIGMCTGSHQNTADVMIDTCTCRLTSPPAWHHCVVVFQSNACT